MTLCVRCLISTLSIEEELILTIDVHRALSLAQQWERLANLGADVKVLIDDVAGLIVLTKKLLTMRYGIGNRHTIAVTEMYESSAYRSTDGTISIGFLRGVAMRIRNFVLQNAI